MRYKATVEDNAWVTVTTASNGGLHDQTAFKSGVAMVEEAIDDWYRPVLIHIVLTKATIQQYDKFIDRIKRDMKDCRYSFKGCTEEDGPDSKKGLHRHYMFIVDIAEQDNPFDLDIDSSIINRALTATRRTAPEFEVTVAQPRRHGTPYIPLSWRTLQDAADWLSYIFKVRSKPTCHRYISSRRPHQVHAKGQQASF